MDQRKSEKKSRKPWRCWHDCKDWETKPCMHLNKLINRESSQSVHANIQGRVDFYKSPESLGEVNDEEVFKAKLKTAGLEDIRISVLVLKFCRDLTFKEIGDILGLRQSDETSKNSAFYLYRSSLRYLRKLGWK